jgi:hypothetical protein
MNEAISEQLNMLLDLHKETQQYMDLKSYIGGLRGLSPEVNLKLKRDVTSKIYELESKFIAAANSYGD